MTKYVLAYHGGDGMPESEAEVATIMEAWGAWFGTMGDALVDGGNPIGTAVTIAPDGSTSPGGGAHALTGYSIINAADMDAAVQIASGCPVLAGNGSVEVAEAIDM